MSLIDMVMVEGGSFMMGCNAGDPEEYPVHEVSIAPFLIGKTPVTQEQYKAVTGTNPSKFTGENLPVEQVSWFAAMRFCNALTHLEGLGLVYSGNLKIGITADTKKNGYRLPFEAEWEYAARGGGKSAGHEYSGSDRIESVGWYRFNTTQTMPVAQMAPNELGLYDMSGNVWEWCFDPWGDYSQPEDPLTSNLLGEKLTRIHRGGSWWSNADMCRSTHRDGHYAAYSSSEIGLRIVRSCA